MAHRRQCALTAAKRIRSHFSSDDETPSEREKATAKPSAAATPARGVTNRENDARRSRQDAFRASDRPPKRHKPNQTTASKRKDIATLQQRLFSASCETAAHGCQFPLRQHSLLYHRPLLLQGQTGKAGRAAVLRWFDSVSTKRCMPWRKDWINPKDYDDASERMWLPDSRFDLSLDSTGVTKSELLGHTCPITPVSPFIRQLLTPTVAKSATHSRQGHTRSGYQR